MASLLSVIDLSKIYVVKRFLWMKKSIPALEPLSFELHAYRTLAIVGGLGSGKSTLAKLLVGAEIPTTGLIKLNNEELISGDFKQRCQHIRMIFQDSGTTLNPSLTIQQILDEPLRLNTQLDHTERTLLIRETLQKVGLLAEHMTFYSHMISSGQKQRVSLARAIILEPKVIILDDALAALDPSLRSQMINLMLDIQQQMGLAFILISQNLGIVRHFSDDIMILSHGKVVEKGATNRVLKNPKHRYTQQLIASQEY